MLRLPHDWVWESWIADDGERYHVFFLRAPRALRDPTLRHAAATVGHASSTDLTHWDVHADALVPAPGRWDDLAIWTGSVVQGPDGVWRMCYTALSTQPGHGLRDQRIGMAESGDLTTWRRTGDPLVAPDRRLYKTLDEDPAASETWRDPFVFEDPGGDGWHMLIAATAAGRSSASATRRPRGSSASSSSTRSPSLSAMERSSPTDQPRPRRARPRRAARRSGGGRQARSSSTTEVWIWRSEIVQYSFSRAVVRSRDSSSKSLRS
jgi:glycosyl hydrolase family 32